MTREPPGISRVDVCGDHPACASSAARAWWLHQGVQNQSVWEAGQSSAACGATFHHLGTNRSHAPHPAVRACTRSASAQACTRG